jgi:predicted RNase H-like HicB family nuclease
VKDYHINVFYSEEDECYIADIPDLRFCSAHGDTAIQAVQEIEIAKSLWLEVAHEKGLEIPEPRYRPAIYAVFNIIKPAKVTAKKFSIPKERVTKHIEATL